MRVVMKIPTHTKHTQTNHDFHGFSPFFNNRGYPLTLSPCSTWSCWRWTRTDAQKTWWPGWANARSATPQADVKEATGGSCVDLACSGHF